MLRAFGFALAAADAGSGRGVNLGQLLIPLFGVGLPTVPLVFVEQSEIAGNGQALGANVCAIGAAGAGDSRRGSDDIGAAP